MGNGSTQSVSRSSWDLGAKRPNLSNDELRFPQTAAGLYQFGRPSTSAARGAADLRDSLDPGRLRKKVAMKLNVNRGHATAHQLKRGLVGTD